jgi:hypothetical protein
MPTVRESDAVHGEKMIRLTFRFWTDGIVRGKGKVRPKHAWSSGVVRVERNASHGIRGGRPFVFRSLPGIGAAIEKALIGSGIRIHALQQARRYSE